MCGRFALTLPIEAMAQMFAAVPSNSLPIGPNFNICPTTQISVVISGENRRLVSMRWGFVPHWYKTPTDGPLFINARGETIAEKPAFRQACRERRCLIPADGYYEWTKTGDGERLPWYIKRRDETPVVFAGIWQHWDNGDQPITSCAIVTTGANTPMKTIHHRMPVIIEPDQFGLWLGEKGKGAAALMTAAPDNKLDFFRVDKKVNSNRTSGPDLIEPIEVE